MTSDGFETAPRRRARVLVIDDEELVLKTMSRMLLRYHDVEVEALPRNALARIAVTDYDVVVCDITMPGLTGMDVYDNIALIKPALAQRVVFATAGAFPHRLKNFFDNCPNVVLRKPFTSEQLLSAIARVFP